MRVARPSRVFSSSAAVPAHELMIAGSLRTTKPLHVARCRSALANERGRLTAAECEYDRSMHLSSVLRALDDCAVSLDVSNVCQTQTHFTSAHLRTCSCSLTLAAGARTPRGPAQLYRPPRHRNDRHPKSSPGFVSYRRHLCPFQPGSIPFPVASARAAPDPRRTLSRRHDALDLASARRRCNLPTTCRRMGCADNALVVSTAPEWSVPCGQAPGSYRRLCTLRMCAFTPASTCISMPHAYRGLVVGIACPWPTRKRRRSGAPSSLDAPQDERSGAPLSGLDKCDGSLHLSLPATVRTQPHVLMPNPSHAFRSRGARILAMT